jgi:hypothetical protein
MQDQARRTLLERHTRARACRRRARVRRRRVRVRRTLQERPAPRGRIHRWGWGAAQPLLLVQRDARPRHAATVSADDDTDSDTDDRVSDTDERVRETIDDTVSESMTQTATSMRQSEKQWTTQSATPTTESATPTTQSEKQRTRQRDNDIDPMTWSATQSLSMHSSDDVSNTASIATTEEPAATAPTRQLKSRGRGTAAAKTEAERRVH